MEGMKWPVERCNHCDFDLTGIEPHARDKSLSEDGSGKPMWSDFCPQCGRGYVVGVREIATPRGLSVQSQTVELKAPAQREVLVEKDKSLGIASPAPSEFYEPVVKAEETLKDSAEKRPKRSDEYWCTKCAKIHREGTKQGKNHLKFREG